MVKYYNLFFLTLAIVCITCFFPSCLHSHVALAREIVVLQHKFPQDSTDEIEEADSTSTIDIDTDSTDEEEPEKSWLFRSGLSYKNFQTQNGINLSGASPVLNFSAGIEHLSGFELSGNIAERIGQNSGFQSWQLGVQYTQTFGENFEILAGIGRQNFQGSDVIFSGNFTTLNLALDYTIDTIHIFEVSGARFWGNDALTMVDVSYFSVYSFQNFKISPMASVTWATYEISPEKALRKTLAGKSTGKVTQKFGFNSALLGSNFTYKIAPHWGIFVLPVVLYTPNKDLSLKDFQFSATVGIRFMTEF